MNVALGLTCHSLSQRMMLSPIALACWLVGSGLIDFRRKQILDQQAVGWRISGPLLQR